MIRYIFILYQQITWFIFTIYKKYKKARTEVPTFLCIEDTFIAD